MKKCVAYLRFSSEGQKDGSSIERQTEIIEPYASRNGLELVETLIDDGFSASKGHHLSHGKLGGFLKNVDAGKYKGFALVVEKMDRFSRLDIKDTFLLTLRLTNGGMELHLAGSNRIIRSLDDLPTSILNSVEAKAAADYVANLTVNIRRGKEKAKDKTEAGGWVYTRRVPAWLEVVGRQNVGNKITDPGKIVPIPEKVVVVREAFRLAGLGVGVKNIARQLNGSALSLTWITRLLSDRSVLGEFQPAGRDPIPNYFPAIVTQSEFNAAREQAARKRRDGKYVGGSRTSHLAENLFTGLIFDKTNGCGMNFQRVRTHRYLRSAFQPDRKPNGMVYDRFEKA